MIVPETCSEFGFVTVGMGAHTGRTVMLRDLSALLAASPAGSSLDDYRNAVLEENVLLKPTASARFESFRRLRQLYGLNQQLTVFRTLRLLWDQDSAAQPLLALLAAVARDPLLRATVDAVIHLPVDTPLDAPFFARIIHEAFPDHLTAKTLASVGRNLASSWAQSGHLSGDTPKTRTLVQTSPIVTAFALFLAYLCDVRGDALFETAWLKLLDTPRHLLLEHALRASQLGWLEYRHAGAITEITFRHLMKDEA